MKRETETTIAVFLSALFVIVVLLLGSFLNDNELIGLVFIGLILLVGSIIDFLETHNVQI